MAPWNLLLGTNVLRDPPILTMAHKNCSETFVHVTKLDGTDGEYSGLPWGRKQQLHSYCCTQRYIRQDSLILRLRNVTVGHTLRMEAEYCFDTSVPLYTVKLPIIYSEHGGRGFLRNVGDFLPNCTASQGGNLSARTAMGFRTLSNCQLLSV